MRISMWENVAWSSTFELSDIRARHLGKLWPTSRDAASASCMTQIGYTQDYACVLFLSTMGIAEWAASLISKIYYMFEDIS